MCFQLTALHYRRQAFVVMANVVEGHTLAHTMGAWVLYASCYCTIGSTYVLFLRQPTVTDMLLNCVALAFLPEVDRAMVTIAKAVRPEKVQVSLNRLAAFGAVWPGECKEAVAGPHRHL